MSDLIRRNVNRSHIMIIQLSSNRLSCNAIKEYVNQSVFAIISFILCSGRTIHTSDVIISNLHKLFDPSEADFITC